MIWRCMYCLVAFRLSYGNVKGKRALARSRPRTGTCSQDNIEWCGATRSSETKTRQTQCVLLHIIPCCPGCMFLFVVLAMLMRVYPMSIWKQDPEANIWTQGGWEWAGHVAWMEEVRSAFKILIGTPAGKGPLGRPRSRWEDNIRMDFFFISLLPNALRSMDLKEIGINRRNLVDSAPDRNYWRALVNAALNLRVS